MNSRSMLDTRLPAADLQVIDAICDGFEADYRAGLQAELTSYLARASHVPRAMFFRELLDLELELRHENGEQPDAQAYYRRFPDLAGVIDAAFESRNTRVTSAHAGRSSAQDGESTVTSPDPIVTGAETSPRAELDCVMRQELGLAGYEIMGELGRGGMGVVLKARQVALNRTVAVKLIKSGVFASESELLRFQNEAEAVAQLDHPHIVPIYEVGQHGGRHFFSMKLIDGTGLDKRLAEFTADPRSAAQIVAIIALAVHHAHQRGILHRDLKPANILLDSDGQPHVTDFGLAKQIKGDGDLTESGAPVGTPAYMSPEQAIGARGSLSTATDVYGVGTVLYALLAGRAPFGGTTLIETLDKVRTCSPERPSQLNDRVPRDLEIICLKCLEKEPARRYGSALALAEDLDRWLEGQPILARPVGVTTRLVMWCRRNKALASLAALLILALLSGLGGVTWKWREADRERAKAEAVNDLLTHQLLAQASLELDPLAKNLTVRELLDRAGSQLGGWLDGQPEIEAKIRETIGGAYLSLAQQDRYDEAERHLRAAIRLDTQEHGPLFRDTLRTNSLLATLLDQTNRGNEAEPLLRRNLQDCRNQLGRDDPVTLDAAERLGTLLWHLGKNDEAETVLRKNVDDRSRVLKPEHPDTLRSTYLLSRVLRDTKKFPDAEHFAYLYAHSVQCSLGSNHPGNILALTNQGDVLRDQGKLAQAEPYYRHAAVEAERILGPEHRSTLAAINNHSRLLSELTRTPALR
jgi:eukaryotic-like serine/threonine-protein kinase